MGNPFFCAGNPAFRYKKGDIRYRIGIFAAEMVAVKVMPGTITGKTGLFAGVDWPFKIFSMPVAVGCPDLQYFLVQAYQVLLVVRQKYGRLF